ncbi:MAG: 30S ribosomal protein S27e [Nitrososphaerota archaeon]|jgi:small subunit ribosomal protein S27e|nr:30S ribosomal protein S27e [Nitrososphaerota archaeon]MDG7020607.1 30S ribosomal protein S27e [Nitrososphaerota archaeon]
MKREREFIPKPRSAFLLVKCPDCGEERPMFSASTRDVTCRGCGRKLAGKTGGKVEVEAPIIKRLD